MTHSLGPSYPAFILSIDTHNGATCGLNAKCTSVHRDSKAVGSEETGRHSRSLAVSKDGSVWGGGGGSGQLLKMGFNDGPLLPLSCWLYSSDSLSVSRFPSLRLTVLTSVIVTLCSASSVHNDSVSLEMRKLCANNWQGVIARPV